MDWRDLKARWDSLEGKTTWKIVAGAEFVIIVLMIIY